MDEKTYASLALGSYLETLGYNNGYWEFNFNWKITNLKDANIVTNHIVHHFFSLGGYQLNISKWNASDDTLLMLATMRACLKGDNLENYMDEYIKILPELKENKRGSGINTISTIKLLSKVRDVNKIPFSEKMGGNGAAIRTSYIGLHYYDNIDKLIEYSIESSRLTHNHTVGFLGGLVTALFTSYAYKNIKPWKWVDMLLKLYESKKIDNFLKKTNIYNKYLETENQFWPYWYKYREERLSKFYLKPKEFMYAAARGDDLLNYNIGINKKSPDFSKFGASGLGATLVAYDSLLLSIVSETYPIDLDNENLKYSYENLVFFSTLHFGDNDSTGCIAGCWFGALTGFKYFNKNKVKELEFKL